MRRALFILFVALSLAGSASAAAYYVDAVNGNDANDGLSEEEAFKTIHKGVWTVPDGQGPLYLMTGSFPYEEWYPGTGYPTRTQYLTVTKLPGHTPVIERLSVYYGMSWWLRFYQLTFDIPDTGSPPGSICTLWLRRGRYLQVIDCVVKGVLQPAPGDPRYRTDYSNQCGIKICETSMDMSGCYDILIQGCTISECGHCGIHLHMDNIGNNIEILDNEISLCACNGLTLTCDTNVYPNGPHDEAPLVQGNYIHEQAVLWAADYSTTAHGSGCYINSPTVTINANMVDSFGNTAAVRTYPVGGTIIFKNIIVTNNLFFHILNPGGEFYRLGTGCKINHNTMIACRDGQSGINYFEAGGPGTVLTWFIYEEPTLDHDDLEFCNNILLGRCDDTVLIDEGHMTGNIMWSIGTGIGQHAVDATHPGNIVLCNSSGDDSNSVPFETDGAYFAGGAWFVANAFEPPVEGTFYWSAGGAGTPGHAYDLIATASVVNFGSDTYTAATDFWGTARPFGAHPDSGYFEWTGGFTPGDRSPVLASIFPKGFYDGKATKTIKW